MRRRLLWLTGIATTMALGFGGVARANVATQHFLKIYKVEKQIDLEGEFPGNTFHDHLFCEAGDYAVDGMWRVEHVDQANPQLGQFGDERSVEITRSYGDNVDKTKWHFEGVNNADGRAQVKLFLTCLGGKTTVVASHQHAITISNRFDDTSHTGLAAGTSEFDHASQCSAGQVPVAPGFRFEKGSGYIYRSWPTSGLLGWHFGFVIDSPGAASVTVYLRCLTLKTGPGGAGPHAHTIIQSFLPNFGGSQRHLGTGITEQQISCGDYGNGAFDQYKGLVGAFWITDPFHVWFLGMDPRPKTRAYRFWNDGGGSDQVFLGLWCYNVRVGKQIAP